MKKISILFLSSLILFTTNSGSDENTAAGKSIHLTLRVLGWQPMEIIGIKYSEPVSKEQIQADLKALAEVHGWGYSGHALEIKHEHGKKLGWQGGNFSERYHLDTNFTLNFQAVRSYFSDADSIIVDIICSNGFTYQESFIASGDLNQGPNSDSQDWQNQFPFQRDWTGLSSYRIRYTFYPPQFSEYVILPTLKTTASFSKTWLLKTIPFLVFLMFMPSVILYLFVRQGASRNERGKIKLSPVKSLIINAQFPLIVWISATLGCANVLSMLTQNRILGGILGITTVPILSYVIFLWVLHRYEKKFCNTTWNFRENLLTNLRMMILGAPILLLSLCYFGTQKTFPELPFLIFLAFLLCQYALLTSFFACIIPFAMSWIWKGKPLVDDTLRQHLQQLAEKAGINYRDIVLLQTKNSKLANAWVAGILPKWRSVFVTDYLLEHLSSNEIETIFAHELGHLKYKHLLKQVAWIVLGFGGQLALIQLSLFIFSFFTGIPAWLYWLSFASVNFGVILLLVQFGLMQFWRRMEFEADAYAVELTQQPSVFLQALRKLIELNDAPEDLDKFNEMLSTHPNFKARADAIEKLQLQER